MIRLALLGAPSSGKTQTAQAISKALDDSTVEVVDDYVQEIEQRSDNTLSYFATYLGNLQVALGRWEAERVAERDQQPDILITCGTVVETGVYEALNALAVAQVDGGGLTIRALQNDKRASVTMTMLGIMCYDTWHYDYAYYIPLDNEEADQQDKMIDKHILESADAMGVTVKEVSKDEAVASIVQDIIAHEQAEIAASD